MHGVRSRATKNGRISTEQARIPCPQKLTPNAIEQDAEVGLRDLRTIQSQRNTVMQQQQEMLRAIADLKTSTKPLPADICVSLDDAKPEMAAPSKLSLWTYDK